MEFLEFESKPPQNRQGILNFCTEHEENTCCSLYHTTQIKKRILSFYDQTFASSRCLELTYLAYCSYCDAEVGTREKNGICPILCDKWFAGCRRDYFEPPAEDDELQFCTRRRSECTQLEELVEGGNATLFCNRMGFVVNGESHCFNGVPTAYYRKLKKKGGRKGKGRTAKIKTGPWQSVIFFFRDLKVYGFYLFAIAMTLSCIYGVYLFNNYDLYRDEGRKNQGNTDGERKKRNKKKQKNE